MNFRLWMLFSLPNICVLDKFCGKVLSCLLLCVSNLSDLLDLADLSYQAIPDERPKASKTAKPVQTHA